MLITMDFRLRRGNQLRKVKVNLISLNTSKLSLHLVQDIVPHKTSYEKK